MALTVVATYDVAEDARRARVAAMLQMHGDRVQKSVFVLTLEAGDLVELRQRVGGTIDLERDSFYVFHQCADCWATLECDGQAQPPSDDYFWIVG